MKRLKLTAPLETGTVTSLNLHDSGPAELFFVKRVDHEETRSIATLQRWNPVAKKALRGRPLIIEFNVVSFGSDVNLPE